MKWNYNEKDTKKNRMRTGFGGNNSQYDNPLSEELCYYINEYVNIRTVSFYNDLYDKVFFLPKSLQKEWLKIELFKLNEELANEETMRLMKGDDATEDYFIVRFLKYNLTDEEFEIYKTYKGIRDGDHWPYQGEPCHIVNIDLHGEPYRGENEKLNIELPRFEEFIDILANLNHYENLVRSYEEMERGEEMTPPQLQSKLTEPQLESLYDLLVSNGFIADNNGGKSNFVWAFGSNKVQPNDWKPITWVKTNSTTNGTMPSKISLLNLLHLLGFHHKTLTNKPLLNKLFAYSNGMSVRFTNSNYSKDGYYSEYSDILSKIVNTVNPIK